MNIGQFATMTTPLSAISMNMDARLGSSVPRAFFGGIHFSHQVLKTSARTIDRAETSTSTFVFPIEIGKFSL